MCEFQDTNEENNWCVIGIPEREEWEKGEESLFKEIMAETLQIEEKFCHPSS